MKRKRYSEEQIIRVLQEGGERSEDDRALPGARGQRADVLPLEAEVRTC